MRFTHLDEHGQVCMVDVSDKKETLREAIARGRVYMQPETLKLITAGQVKKGDVFTTAKIAGIMAAKRTSELIPMCHPLNITHIDIKFSPLADKNAVEIESVVKITGRTGVEMEALTAVSVAALTIYDMCKAVDKGMTIADIHLIKKTGGKSGTYIAEEEDEHR
ncbi:MAG: cyclic pyranopterin monophosphate synthase MoaC [Candidatus Desulfofervidaceae bacterium]|nr:cyclic pyranopterin monophosphate synthase MoaC [Candidatus Desulfofervidaceae bacterium]MDL1971142.1 cyclic pyranopterin monophosphate synthase MoaC [Candidatus Desulfofervidaceae bacterium]